MECSSSSFSPVPITYPQVAYPQGNFFYYNTPPEKLYARYVPLCDTGIKMPYKSGERVLSLFPRSMALIQMTAAAALTAFAVSLTSAPTLAFALTAAGIAFIGWRIYKNFLCNDPLVEAFYKIVGGKDKFEKLPFLPFKMDQNIQDRVSSMDFNSLSHSMYRSHTTDGRHVLLVKGKLIKGSPKKLFAFVEKFSPFDFLKPPATALIASIATCLLSLNNRPNSICINNTEMGGSISTNMANEFYLQAKYRG